MYFYKNDNMKKKFFAFVIAVTLTSCFGGMIPLKGKYQDAPFQATSTNNKEVVWGKVIDMFAQKGLSIKIIDKSSGLIVSERSKLLWTYEDKNGQLENSDAHIVIEKPKKQGVGVINPQEPLAVTGEWNIRVKDSDNGGTLINVNLVNIKQTIPGANRYSGNQEVSVSGTSTGNFEKIIYDTVK